MCSSPDCRVNGCRQRREEFARFLAPACGVCGRRGCLVDHAPYQRHEFAPNPPGKKFNTEPFEQPKQASGWLCPRCGVSHAPSVQRCDCKPAHEASGPSVDLFKVALKHLAGDSDIGNPISEQDQ